MQGEKQPADDGRRKGKYVRVVIIGAGAILALALMVNRLLPTPEEALAAFDAVRAVPDEDNAALIYADLLRGDEVPPSSLETQLAPFLESVQDPVSLQKARELTKKLAELELPEGLLDPNDETLTLLEPWTSAAYPELRQWLDTHQDRIDRLLEAAQKPACYFPLRPEPNEMGLFDMPSGALRQNAWLLRRAANNDMGDGRTAAGLQKYQALISIGQHLNEQPAALQLLIGIAWETLGLHHLIDFLATGPATDQDLDVLSASCSNLEDDWKSLSQGIIQVRKLFSHTMEDRRSFKLRLYWWYRSVRYPEDSWMLKDRGRELYHRVLSERRALCILIELRRFRNRTGHWPETLDEIASSVVPLALLDPQNGGAYVYHRTQDGFRLYSAGPNGQDENGRYTENGPDDWPLWPTYRVLARRKAIEDRRQAQTEDTAAESSPQLPPGETAESIIMKKLAEIYGEGYRRPGQEDANAP